MAGNGGSQYRYETKKVLRGREASTIAKMQAEGWELDRQKSGRVQTELNFRRLKKPIPWRLITAGAAAAVLAIAAIGVFLALGTQSDDPPTDAAASDSTASNGDPSNSSDPSNEATATSSESPPPAPSESAATASESPTPQPSATPTATEAPSPTLAPDAVLTVDNSPDLKRLLRTGADPAVSRAFADQYAGRAIEFDGAVYDTQPYEDYDTRFNFLVLARNFDPNLGGDGPSFQFRDVNFYDLNVQGRASSVGTGDNIRVVAEVVAYEQRTGLFLLEPISTRLR